MIKRLSIFNVILIMLMSFCFVSCANFETSSFPSGPSSTNEKTNEINKGKKKLPHGYPEIKPDTIDKAIDILLVVLTEDQKSQIKNTKKGDLIKYHLSLGMWIRNNFGLWHNNIRLLNELGGGHPDDASFVLIKKLWKELNE